MKKSNKNNNILFREKKALDYIYKGELNKAEYIYKSLIDEGFANYSIYINLAVICAKKNNQNERILFLNKAIELNPSSSIAFNNLGNAFRSIYNLDSAITSYRTALNLRPNYPEAECNLGIAFQEKGSNELAINSFRRALELKPNYPEAFSHLGIALFALGEIEESIIAYRTALNLRPNYPEAECNLGVALQEKGSNELAINSFRKALELKPNYPEALSNLGVALFNLGHIYESINSYKTAIELNPKYYQAFLNLGNSYQAIGDHVSSQNCYKKAIKIRSGYASANWNLSLSYLLCGQYELGWLYYHWRSKIKGALKPHSQPKIREYNSNNLVKGESLLVVTEQGLGDTIQYMRYIPYIRNLGIDVSFCAQSKLHKLIKASNIDCNPLTPEEGNFVTNGRWISLLSIPKVLNVKPTNPIITKPYISATEDVKKKWKYILNCKKRPLIALNWQGNPNLEKTNYKGRSIPLEKFSKILQKNDVTFLSLQKGFGSEQLDTCSFKEKFIHSQDIINSSWDFHDNAAIIHHCDLIITCDTAVAHLAGGMGKKVWLLLRDLPFWTWGLNDDTTFWYPSMKLFRQTTSGNWDEVMDRVSDELKQSIHALAL
tara:strand:+ start:1533 stop:3344 length:1812 start_codon:yes stop_codon:yes gene_type:complete